MSTVFFTKVSQTGELIPTQSGFLFSLFGKFPKNWVINNYTRLLSGAEVTIAGITFVAKTSDDQGGKIL